MGNFASLVSFLIALIDLLRAVFGSKDKTTTTKN